jgi:hypothetical protein
MTGRWEAAHRRNPVGGLLRVGDQVVGFELAEGRGFKR